MFVWVVVYEFEFVILDEVISVLDVVNEVWFYVDFCVKGCMVISIVYCFVLLCYYMWVLELKGEGVWVLYEV